MQNTPGSADRHASPMQRDEGDAPPASTRSDRRVHEGSEESFPASDPPSYMGSRSPESGTLSRDRHEPITWSRSWAATLVNAIDHGEAVAVADMLAEDGVFRAGYGAPLVGRSAIARSLTAWLEADARTVRHIVDVREIDDVLFIELDASGETDDGQRLSWPEAISVHLRRSAGAPPSASRVTWYGAPVRATMAADRREDAAPDR